MKKRAATKKKPEKKLPEQVTQEEKDLLIVYRRIKENCQLLNVLKDVLRNDLENLGQFCDQLDAVGDDFHIVLAELKNLLEEGAEKE